jgi:hypothetical protein
MISLPFLLDLIVTVQLLLWIDSSNDSPAAISYDFLMLRESTSVFEGMDVLKMMEEPLLKADSTSL